MTAYFILFILFSIISLVCIYFVDKVTYINDIIFCSSVALLLIFGLTAAIKSYQEREQQKIEKNSRSISTDGKVENTISFKDSLENTTEYKLLINE
jgi:arginine exporter protein ArgO